MLRERLHVPTSSLLQAISIVDEETIWISGHDASFVRTINGGTDWELFQHPTEDSLQFRDIHAFDQQQAILMSAGKGSLSRIYGFDQDAIWSTHFIMEDTAGFLDCMDFWDEKRGVAYGDSFDGYPYILLTVDGGISWQRADKSSLPKAGKGEGGFAASGTCVTTGEGGRAWIATGAGNNCRILLSSDYGKTWNFVDSPLTKGKVAGNTSVSFNGSHGFVVGGDLLKPNEYTDNCAFSEDGGYTWRLTNQPNTPGAFYGGAITKFNQVHFSFACGPNGLDYTKDLGENWVTLDTLNYWAVSFMNQYGYAVGKGGNILKITLKK